MKMTLKHWKLYVAALLLASCAQLQSAGTAVGNAVFPQTPEAQIAAGANSLTAATTLATVALRNDKITVVQAKSYRTLLGAASSALDDANGALEKCRTATGSTSATSPDPCKPSVVSVIALALDSIANVKRTLDAAK